MANIQYADDGIYTVNFHAEDDCGNRTTGVRTINVRERQFTISFDSKGGSVVAAILVNEGDDATGFAEPTKEGVAFKGWYDNPYCYGDPITTIEDVQQDYTLYAKWGDESYSTILFGSTNQTLVINCPESKKAQYTEQYGAIYSEYPAWSRENEYDFSDDGQVPWGTRRANIQRLIIGAPLKPNNMSLWFYGFVAISDVQGLEKIDTSRCTKMNRLFEDFHYTNKPLDVSMWDVSQVTGFFKTFGNAYFSTLNVSGWVTSSARDMMQTFQNMQLTGTNPVVDLSTWDFSHVTSMYQMFAGSTMHTLNLGNPNTVNVTDFYQMFAMCAVTTIYSDDFDRTSEGSTSGTLFSGASNLVGGNGTAYDSSHVGTDYAVVDKPGRPGYFTAPTYVTVTFDPNNGDPTSETTYPTGIFIDLPTPTHPEGREFYGWHFESDLSDEATFRTKFYNSCTLYGEWEEARLYAYLSFDEATGELKYFHDEPNKYTHGQIIGTKRYWVDALDIDKEYWEDIHQRYVTDPSKTIYTACKAFVTDASTFTFGSAYRMCELPNVEYIDLTGVEIRGPHCQRMFYNTVNLQTLIVDDGWLWPDNIHDISYMFDGSNISQSDLSDALGKLSNVPITDITNTFNGVKAQTINMVELNGTGVTAARHAFSNCTSLRTILVDPNRGWDLSAKGESFAYEAFKGDTNLTGGAGTGYASNHTGTDYFRIDNQPDNPGYLTSI